MTDKQKITAIKEILEYAGGNGEDTTEYWQGIIDAIYAVARMEDD